MKPCQNKHGDYREGCRLCFLARTDPKYAAHWGEPWDGTVAAITHPPTPIAKREWPLFARAIGRLRSREDRGIGDTIHRNLGRLGANALTKLYKRWSGRNCGCENRQAALNSAFPY